ncbi:hypothetical protein Tco_0410872 [Tanacetum coccineum]
MEGSCPEIEKTNLLILLEDVNRAFKRVIHLLDFRFRLGGRDTAERQSLMEVIPDEEEVAIDDVPLAIKSPTGVSTAQRLQRKYAKCLLLLVHNCSAEVNAASENMLEVTTASEYQVNAAS